MAKVGFIGLGVMGSQMVNRLLSKGHSVTGYNRTRSKHRFALSILLRIPFLHKPESDLTSPYCGFFQSSPLYSIKSAVACAISRP
jgi:nucleoside-diphosphate-sugar epimerase